MHHKQMERIRSINTMQTFSAAPLPQYFMPDLVPSIVNVVINDTITRNYAGSGRSVDFD